MLDRHDERGIFGYHIKEEFDVCGMREVHVDFSSWHNRIIQLGTYRYTIKSIVLLYLGYYLRVGFGALIAQMFPLRILIHSLRSIIAVLGLIN